MCRHQPCDQTGVGNFPAPHQHGNHAQCRKIQTDLHFDTIVERNAQIDNTKQNQKYPEKAKSCILFQNLPEQRILAALIKRYSTFDSCGIQRLQLYSDFLSAVCTKQCQIDPVTARGTDFVGFDAMLVKDQFSVDIDLGIAVDNIKHQLLFRQIVVQRKVKLSGHTLRSRCIRTGFFCHFLYLFTGRHGTLFCNQSAIRGFQKKAQTEQDHCCQKQSNMYQIRILFCHCTTSCETKPDTAQALMPFPFSVRSPFLPPYFSAAPDSAGSTPEIPRQHSSVQRHSAPSGGKSQTDLHIR